MYSAFKNCCRTAEIWSFLSFLGWNFRSKIDFPNFVFECSIKGQIYTTRRAERRRRTFLLLLWFRSGDFPKNLPENSFSALEGDGGFSWRNVTQTHLWTVPKLVISCHNANVKDEGHTSQRLETDLMKQVFTESLIMDDGAPVIIESMTGLAHGL